MAHNLKDALMGGPGLDGYTFAADVYCIDHGRAIIRQVFATRTEIDDLDFTDSEILPQPIFFGESPDCAQYCADCGTFLYGNDPDEKGDGE